MYTKGRVFYNTWEDWVHAKFGDKIKEECKNFVFLEDGSMKYDFDKFDDYIDAMIDAIKNGEDIDRIISLVFREPVDQPIVKQKLINIMNDDQNKNINCEYDDDVKKLFNEIF